MRVIAKRVRRAFTQLWRGLREWCGDAAYEKYLQCARRESLGRPLTATEFYLEQMNRKYARPNRCC
jgi:uncharacterized short protein YbdD (DUF466 family)